MHSSHRGRALLIATILLAAPSCEGPRGISCTVMASASGSAIIVCEDGTTATVSDGNPGSSCTVTEEDGVGRVIRCDDGTIVTVPDGEAGPSGTPGNPGDNAHVVGSGLLVTIGDAVIQADRKPAVTLTITDRDGRPLDRDGLLTEGEVTVSFTISALANEVDGHVGQYTPYLVSGSGQPGSDSGGTWTKMDSATGTYRYVFSAALPETYDPSLTHTVALYASRSFSGVRYDRNAVFSFRPDGAEVTSTREIVTTAACNQCHNPLSAHGGRRQEIGLCITCHTDGYQDPDTGNSIDLRVMVHKIHMGAELPSVQAGTPYQIIGYRDSVHDYSDVVFPQSVANCASCHQGAQGHVWQTQPTQAACGSCHDRTSFAEPVPDGMTLHPGGARTDDSTCSVCHTPSGGIAGIADLHLTPSQDPASPQLVFEILSVTNTGPSDIPELTFRVEIDGVGRDVLTQPLDSMRVTVSGPTTDYAGSIQYDMKSTGSVVAVNAAAGEFRYTFPSTMSDIVTAISSEITPSGSFAFGMEGYFRLVPGGTRYAALNPVTYTAVTDTTAQPRREIVDLTNCNRCHDQLSFHGGSRRDPEYCVMCHTAELDTSGRMPAPSTGTTAITTSVRFSSMIHRIHAGDHGSNPYVVYSNGGSPIDFAEVRFPGDLRDCSACHLPGTELLPVASGLRPSRTHELDDAKNSIAEFFMGATAAACTGCHDTPDVAVHAELMTNMLGTETCAVCHGSGDALGVDIVHARPEFQ